MSEKIYGVALIGCGCMGKAHLDDIYYKENVRVEYVCDLDLSRAKSFQRKYNARRIETDYKKVINSENVDIVIIATYPSTHYEILKYCIEHKKHVICEKPIARDIETGRKMVELIKANPDCKVLIGYILRHNKTYCKVAEMIHSGAIGKPVIMRMAQNHHTMDWHKYLNLIKETPPIVDCGVHYVDVMRWFSGAEIKSVEGIGMKSEPDVPEGSYNYGLITVRMTDGSIAYYEAGWGNTMRASNLKEFVGPKGRITIEYRHARESDQEEGDLIEYYKYPEKEYQTINVVSKRKPTGAQLDNLIDMIENNSKANPTIDDVWKSFQCVLEADKYIKERL